ncbi:MAG: DUF167 domain-containing protein [Patescibacteria group bacterium]
MIFKVFVHPNSKKPRIDKDLLGSLHIYVNQPPLDGKANKAVLEALAKHFRVSKSKVSLLRGDKSKIKVFSIET